MSVFWANQPPFYNLEINNSRDYKDNFKSQRKHMSSIIGTKLDA